MKSIKDFLLKNKIGVGGVVFGVISFVASLTFTLLYKCPKCDECSIGSNEIAYVNMEEDNTENYIKVDVKGAVKKSGVYSLPLGSTISDAIDAAGGITSSGVTTNINMAKKLSDEMVVYVFTKSEIAKNESANKMVCEVPKCECEKVVVDNCADKNASANNSTVSTSGLISINTATLEELMTLDGIGEAKAKAIIAYRSENGAFKSINEIMNVSGISEKAFEKIKDKIKI